MAPSPEPPEPMAFLILAFECQQLRTDDVDAEHPIERIPFRVPFPIPAARPLGTSARLSIYRNHAHGRGR